MQQRKQQRHRPPLTERQFRFVVAARDVARMQDLAAVLGVTDTVIYRGQRRFGERLPRGRAGIPLTREALSMAYRLYLDGQRPSLSVLSGLDEEGPLHDRDGTMWTTGEVERLRLLAGTRSILDIGRSMSRTAVACRNRMELTPHGAGTLYDHHRRNTSAKLAAELHVSRATISDWRARRFIRAFNDVRNPGRKEAVVIVDPFDADWLRGNYRWKETNWAALWQARDEE